jgi:hypothetical protein
VFLEDRVEKSFLAAEVVLERRRVLLAGRFGDLVERNALETASGEQLLGGGNELVSSALGRSRNGSLRLRELMRSHYPRKSDAHKRREPEPAHTISARTDSPGG